MTDGFDVTVTDDTITVVTEAFTLVFDKERVGITSFKYETGGTWHEGVNTGAEPPSLFGPYFSIKDYGTGFLYPDGGTELELRKNLGWFLEIYQLGWLRNSLIPGCTDFPVEVWWRIWPSGRLINRVWTSNDSGEHLLLMEEAWQLNPADDPDINPGRDEPPNLDWLGFFSANEGSGSGDKSHDAIVLPMQLYFLLYGESGKANRIYHENVMWSNMGVIACDFAVALSVNGSWGDIEDPMGFQNRGDALSLDYQNPDPLDGSPNAGDVLVGIRVFSGYDYEIGAYTIQAI